MMLPSVEQLVDAQNTINAQHPYLARIPAGEAVDVTLTAEQLATIASALGVASGVQLTNNAWATTSPEQTAWAGIIDVALTARGAPPDEMRSEAFAALTRVDAPTLERMATLVLGVGIVEPRPRPVTPSELTRSLDVLLAEYLLEHPAALPSQTSVAALLEWNGDRIRAAVEPSPDTPETVAAKARGGRAALDAFRREVSQ
jgi:hypothetical protein